MRTYLSSHRYTRALLFAAAAAIALSWSGDRPRAQGGSVCGTDMRVLVLSASGVEADLPAIQAALDYLGTPYDVYVVTQHPEGVPASLLANDCHAFYQSVILATDNLVYAAPGGSYVSALSPTDVQTLETFEATFGVRQVTWYTFPTPSLGFNYPTTASGDPLQVSATTAGAQVFPYLAAGVSIPIQYSWTYQATVLDGTTTPLLTDADGHALAAIHVYPDGRENLAMTFDSNAYVTHAMLLSYGVINWATRGLFVGDRHTYVSPQIDDLFIDNTRWLESTQCGTNVDATGELFRISGADLAAVSAWQGLRRQDPLTAGLRITMAFNGIGSTGAYSLTVGQNDTLIGGVNSGPAPDTLTPAVRVLQGDFLWASHTFDHENLDALSYAQAAAEITQNTGVAADLGLTAFSTRFLVQPDVSGLGNPGFLAAAYDNGLRFLLSDTSKPGQDNPSPNVGFWNRLGQPGIFVIPRRANNLFFNVTTPADWVAEYNCHYASYWGRNLSYAEVLDQESGQLLAHLLRGELDPWMFHQPNLATYDGAHTLLTDLLDATFARYGSYVTVPIISPPPDVVGQRMADRTTLRANGVTATITPGVGLVLTSPVDVTVPVTGLRTADAEFYAGQWISWIPLHANQPFVAPLSFVAAPAVEAGAPQSVPSAAPVTLSGTASDLNQPAQALTLAWSQTAGPSVTLSDATTATASFTAPTLSVGDAAVTLGFTLTATNTALSSSASTMVTVTPPIGPPSADAGAAQAVPSGAAVVLAGSAADPNVPAQALTYSWIQTSGPAVSLAGANTLAPSFSAPLLVVGNGPVTLAFQLSVSNATLTASGSTTVTVVPPIGPPVPSVGPPQFVVSGAPVTLSGAATDPNVPVQSLSFAWAQSGGPSVTLANAGTPGASFTAPDLPAGSAPVPLSFTLTVSNTQLSAIATTTIVVEAPVAATQTVSADGPGSQTTAPIDVPAGTLLVAFVSSDGPVEAAQSVSVTSPALAWTLARRENSQPGTSEVWYAQAPADLTAVTISSDQAIAVAADETPLVQSLSVLAFANARGVGAVAGAGAGSGVPVVAIVPQAGGSLFYAVGNDGAIASPRTVPAGQVVEHEFLGAADSHWRQRRAPDAAVAAAGTAVMLADTAPDANHWNIAAIEIRDRRAPDVAAGPAQAVASGASVVLAGSASDVHVPALPLAAHWTQISGPGVSLSDANTLAPAFTAPTLPVGAATVTLGFTLTVSNGFLSSLDSTTVSVAAPVGPPAVSAGPSQDVLSGAAVALSGSATDPNTPPQALTYQWTQTGGASVTLTGADTIGPTFTAPLVPVGVPPVALTFSLRASNLSQSASSTTTVVVHPPIGPPSVTVTPSQQTLSGTSVVLRSTALDPNAPTLPLTYAWTQTAGPGVTLSGAAGASATFVAPVLQPADAPVTVGFTLSVSNGVLTSSSATTVLVQPPVPPPTLVRTVASDGQGNRTTTAFPANAGDLLVAFVSAQGPSAGSQTAAVSGAGATWTLARRVNTRRGTSEVWSAVVPTVTASAVVTATLASTANPASLTVMAFSGAGGVGVTAGANAASGAPAVGLTTSRANSLVFAVGDDPDHAVVPTPNAGQNILRQYLGTASGHWIQGLTGGAVPTAGTAVTIGDAAPTADRWNYAAVEIVAVPPPASLVPGLVAAYGFNEGNGSTVTDASGLGNTGAISGAAWTTGGRFGNALAFDGTSAMVTVPDAPSLSLDTAMTVEAWVKPATLTGWQTILFKELPSATGTAWGWALYSSDSSAPPAVYAMMAGSIGNAQYTHATGTANLPLNTWSHVAGTFDGSSLRLYVNGTLVRTLALAGRLTVTPGPLRIGGHSGSAQFYNGLLDEIRVYNRALTASEIQADMNAPLQPAVMSVTPTSGWSGLTPPVALTATFNEAMNAATVNASTIRLQSDAGPIASTVSYNAVTRTVTLTPTAALPTAANYTATVSGGPTGVLDPSGNAMSADFVWAFAVAADTTPPAITAVKAAPGTTSAVITWTTDEASTTRIDYGTTSGSLTQTASVTGLVTSHSVTLTGLSTGVTHYYRVTSADGSGNAATSPPTSSPEATFVTTLVPGLVAAYGFNEGSGGTVSDASGLGNIGTIAGATWTTGGRFGNALAFDGTSSTVTVADAPSLALSAAMTVEAWVKPTTLTGWQTILFKELPTASGTAWGWALYSSDSTAPPAVYAMMSGSTGNAQYTHATGTALLPLNTWSHVAGTFDGSSLRLYVNGTLVKTLALAGQLTVTPGPLRIGGHSGSGQFFNGLLDEIRVYNRTLSAAEIQADMTTALP